MARRQDSVPLRQLLPNLVTIIGLCAGLTSIRHILLAQYDMAVILIAIAAVMDALDGLIARRLDAASTFGAEIDSLSDFLCFGVAPALLVYQFALADVHGVGWVFVLVYAVCACRGLPASTSTATSSCPKRPGRILSGCLPPVPQCSPCFPCFCSSKVSPSPVTHRFFAGSTSA